MAVTRIIMEGGRKMCLPVRSREQFLADRGAADHKARFKAVREGNDKEKEHLIQYNYTLLPPKEKCQLRGYHLVGNSFGHDIDCYDKAEADRIAKKILSMKDELHLLMLERTAHYGLHSVHRREMGKTILESQVAVAMKLDAEMDTNTKDLQRVWFASTDDADELLFLDDALFECSMTEEEAEAEYQLLCQRTARKEDDVPEEARKSNKHYKILSPAQSGEGLEERSGGDGLGLLPYHLIIPAFFQMECQTYPEVPEGTRNDTIFTVCAKYLRYCTDHSFEKLKQLLWPKYAFGIDEREMDSIIRSALSRERSLTPKVVKYVIRKFTNQPSSDDNATEEPEGGLPYRPLADCIIDESMLPMMPRWVNVMLKIAPPGYKFITLAATVPAMMTLLTDVNCKFGTKKVTRLNGWTHVDGPPASNKSITLSAIPVLMKPLQDIDDANQAREDAWYEKKEQALNKKEQPPKLKDIVIRILPANTTRHQHIRRMFDAKGKHTYTYCEEVQSLDLANRASYSNRSDFMQLLFDNGMTGNQSMHAAGMRCRTQVAWNLSTSGTRDQTLRTWGNCATNGATTRVFFCLVPDNSKAPMPQYVQYTEQDEELLHRAAQIMMEMNGLVKTPKLDKALYEWVEKMRLESIDAEDNERLILKNRSADIAHKFGVVMHLAWAVQNIMDTEDREQRKIEVRDLDLGTLKERQSSVDTALYAAGQCLDGQYRLWARKMKQQLESAYEGTAVFKKSDRQYVMIPEQFTYSKLQSLFPDKKLVTLRKMVERFKLAGTVVDTGKCENGEKVFRKTDISM